MIGKFNLPLVGANQQKQKKKTFHQKLIRIIQNQNLHGKKLSLILKIDDNIEVSSPSAKIYKSIEMIILHH